MSGLEQAVEELVEATGSHKVLQVRAEDLPSRDVGEVLRATQIAREWLNASTLPPERATPFRCFVLGYLAAVKDRT